MSETKISDAKLLLDLPMDEIRNDAIINLAVGNAAATIPATGTPKVIYDYYMGSSIGFYGKESFRVDEVKIPPSQGCTIECWFNIEPCQNKNDTWQQLFYFKSNTTQSAWGIHTRCQDQGLFLYCFAPTQNSIPLANKIDTDKWMHLALCMGNDGSVKVYLNAALINEHGNAFAKQFVSDTKSFLLQIGARNEIDFFHGQINQFKCFAGVRSAEEIKLSMLEGRSANATFKSSYPIEVKLNSVDNGSENPVLYIENNTDGHPFRIDMLNTSGTAVKFAGGPVPDFTLSENDYHIQLRFKKNVIATEVLDNLVKKNNQNLDGWAFLAGRNTTLLEDWISFKRLPANANEDFKGLLSITLPNMRAEAMAGARNTLVEIKYNNLYYKDSQRVINGSLTRHLDIISHLGKRNVPFDTSVKGTTTIINDGQTKNNFDLVIRNIAGEPIRFTAMTNGSVQHSKFALYSKEPVTFNAKPAISFAGAKFREDITTAEKNLPKTFNCADPTLQLKADNDQLTIEVRDFVTAYPSGTLMLYLEYKNIPGYWDGVIPVTLKLGSVVESNNKVGINKFPEKEKDYDLQVKGNIKSDARVFDQTGFIMPVGAIIAYGGNTAPEGWLLCDGKTNLRSNPAYAQLQKILNIDTTPNLRNQFIVGAGTDAQDYKLRDTGGAKTVTLAEAHIPAHKHTGTTDKHDVLRDTGYKLMSKGTYDKRFVEKIHDGTVAFGKVTADTACGYDSACQSPVTIENVINASHTHNFTTSEYGRGQAHENMPPYYALTYIIKY